MYNKNEKINLEIIDMTYDGLGIAKNEGIVFFVKGSVVGDIVEAIVTKNCKNKLIYAKAINIIKQSKDRVEPICKIANKCGGCILMPLSYKKQLELKINNVKNCLKRIGKFEENEINNKFEGIISFDDANVIHYRNKLQVPFIKREGKVVYGFYAYNTHYVIENDNCIVGFEGSNDILKDIKKFLEDEKISIYDEKTFEGYFREVVLRCGNNSKEISVTFVVGKTKYKNDKHSMEKLSEVLINKYNNITTITLNVNTKNNNVIMGDKNFILYGNGYIKDNLCGIDFNISPQSFYQVNNIMTEKLYNTVIEFGNFDNNEEVIDMYCGIGTISLIISKYVKSVLGVEIIEKAIENANENAKINNIKNTEFKLLDASKLKISSNDEKYVEDIDKKFDTVIVDPPRKGLDKNTIEYIKYISPKKIIYVSCDPSTLSRDLNILCDKTNNNENYNILKIKCVDMFPNTMHVESVVLLSKK